MFDKITAALNRVETQVWAMGIVIAGVIMHLVNKDGIPVITGGLALLQHKQTPNA